ncbi:KAP family P-loop NTPase fold protein [Chitinophaga sp. ARDCPP14]|uniref:KAP family P-loop NTPase fold protein n=1 Tax=Chitinophaga sp. ARDCPP14 TaxID=3391139 RepID=UPI003F526C64
MKRYVIEVGDNLVVSKVFTYLDQGHVLNVIISVFFIYGIFKLFDKIKNGLIPPGNGFFNIITILLIYFFIIRFNDNYVFFSFQNWGLPILYYTDLVLFSLLLLWSNYKSYKRPLKIQNEISLIEDCPDSENDSLSRSGYADQVASVINSTTSKNSFSIGIFAEWGAGKTDFLNRLENQLKLNSDNLIINFNVWKTSSTDSLIEDFFVTLSSSLKKYNKSIGNKLKSYSKKLFQPGKEIYFRLLDTLINEVIPDESISETYNSINEGIQQTGKRIIVFIDDIDRLNAIEILNVLKLIRNTANFSNTFFIVALDPNYVIQVLRRINLLSKEEEYLKKVFQLIIPLPKIQKSIYVVEFKSLLQYDSLKQDYKDKIDHALNNLAYGNIAQSITPLKRPEHFLEGMIDNMRDLKRFTNIIKLNFSFIMDELDVIDYFILALLQVKRFDIYINVSNREFVKVSADPPFKFQFDTEKWTAYKEKNASFIDESELTELQKVLEYLFEDRANRSPRTLVSTEHFWLYFSFQLFNSISYKEFTLAINGDQEDLNQFLNKWAFNDYRELAAILETYGINRNKDEFQKFVTAFIKVGGFQNFLLNIVKQNLAEDGDSLYDSDEEYVDVIMKILNDESLPEYNKAIIADYLIKERSIGSGFSKPKLEKIISDGFIHYLNSDPEFSNKVMDHFLLVKDQSNTRKAYAKYLLKKPNTFEEYLRFVIRPLMQPPHDKMFVFDPMLKLILSADRFSAEIAKLKPTTIYGEKIVSLIQKYIPAYDLFDNAGFQVTDEEFSYLINHMKETGQVSKNFNPSVRY